MASERRCERCAGTGFIRTYMHVLAGICHGCNGTGRITVYTAAEKAAMATAFTRRNALIRALNNRATELGRDCAYEVADGRDHLETHVPDRHALMLDAIENGRTDDVITCLRAYAQANVYRHGVQ